VRRWSSTEDLFLDEASRYGTTTGGRQVEGLCSGLDVGCDLHMKRILVDNEYLTAAMWTSSLFCLSTAKILPVWGGGGGSVSVQLIALTLLQLSSSRFWEDVVMYRSTNIELLPVSDTSCLLNWLIYLINSQYLCGKCLKPVTFNIYGAVGVKPLTAWSLRFLGLQAAAAWRNIDHAARHTNTQTPIFTIISIKLAAHKYWIVASFRHFLRAELINLSHY